MAAVPDELKVTAEEYRRMVGREKPPPPLLQNALKAFFSGGTICLLGQVIQNIYIAFGFSPEDASNPTVVTVIFFAALFTGLGLFDRLALFAGAGTAVPVTGFSNSLTAAALEFKKEGAVLGIGARIFSLAGSVLLFGVVTAFVVGLISALF
ncbi:MAG TPA: stage V sporulation protein AC [Firmicutes bacterium]|jgi:stage V sporulation protein AC|nr:stage V sporulation protein AC [Bacillota bacterium]